MRRTALAVMAAMMCACSTGAYKRHYFEPSFGLGELKVDVRGGQSNDSAAWRMGLAYEYDGKGIGAGVRAFTAKTTDGFSQVDGTGNVVDGTHVRDSGGFAHVTLMASSGRFDVPLRIGPTFERIREDGNLAAGGARSELVYDLWGAKAELVPTVNFQMYEELVLSLFVGGHVGVASVHLDADALGTKGTEDTKAMLHGYQTGLRVGVARNTSFALTYTFRDIHIDDTDLDNVPTNGRFPGREYEFNGFLLTGSVRF